MPLATGNTLLKWQIAKVMLELSITGESYKSANCKLSEVNRNENFFKTLDVKLDKPCFNDCLLPGEE